jgi:hypothetical protein
VPRHFRRRRITFLAQPAGQQHQGVEPQRVDLDRLAAPRRDDPVFDLSVHPRQLIAFGALAQEAVGGIDQAGGGEAREVPADRRLLEVEALADRGGGRLAAQLDGHEHAELRAGQALAAEGVVVDPRQQAFEPPDPGTEVRTKLILITEEGALWVFRQCFQGGNVQITRRKAPNVALLPVQFRLEKPTGESPFIVYPTADGLI